MVRFTLAPIILRAQVNHGPGHTRSDNTKGTGGPFPFLEVFFFTLFWWDQFGYVVSFHSQKEKLVKTQFIVT